MENLNKNPKLFVVVPCYNEEEVIAQSFEILHKKLSCMIERQIIAQDSALVFVDDGSKDKTWQILKNLTHSCPPPHFEAKDNRTQTFSQPRTPKCPFSRARVCQAQM
ncbi:glycosyltransferase [Helicobacter sp. 10-6591]|uniref:glycosyltransferase n=1 Tax=Helicobacter sp. 10-6591 TaxID=2004998 RepID=UPI00215BF511|nr:glycosyltransferase [Helicobacter sp. 10-6591]